MKDFSLRKITISCGFLLLLVDLSPDPLYLNNANPFPLFSASGRYDYLARASREEAKAFFLKESCPNHKEKEENVLHANFMPYFQTATSGTNYEGKDTLTFYNNRYQSATPLDTTSVLNEGLVQNQGAQAATGTNAGANIVRTVPMPLGAIPEPFNFFALFYPFDPIDPIEPQVYKTGQLLRSEYCAVNQKDNECENAVPLEEAQFNTAVPSGISNFNQVSKVVARYLGMNDTPGIRIESAGVAGSDNPDSIGEIMPSPLMYDYSNYKNSYFGLLQTPESRDPQKLFGYGYFNNRYTKFGVRGTIEWRIAENYGIKIYTGFSNIDVDQINILDTTINYQGPTAAYMYARYPDQIYNITTSTTPQVAGPYQQPNLYSLSPYDSPIMDNTSNAMFNPNFYNTSQLKNYLPDEFKTAFIQKIQYNLDSLGRLINQDFRPYTAQSFDDTTFELFYRRLILYDKKIKKGNEEINPYTPFTLLPTAAVHVTLPIAPRVPGNKVFAKAIDNNGHIELGANLGIEFDFIHNIAFGCDVGFSWYNSSLYTNVPVPTNQLNGGIYLYSASLIRNPGFSYTAGIGMQVDKLFDRSNLFCEYRVVRHAEDTFNIKSINNLLPVERMENTHTTPVSDETETLDTIPNGILYVNYQEALPYPTPLNVVTNHLREISSWSVQMLNLTFNYEIFEDMLIGIAYQQPLSLRNALNATTLGISFEMYI